MKATAKVLDILFPKVRAEILRVLFSDPARQRYVRELMIMSGLALRTVQEELANLSAAGLITSWSNGYHRFYRANRDHPLFSALLRIVQTSARLPSVKNRRLAEGVFKSKTPALPNRIHSIKDSTGLTSRVQRDRAAGVPEQQLERLGGRRRPFRKKNTRRPTRPNSLHQCPTGLTSRVRRTGMGMDRLPCSKQLRDISAVKNDLLAMKRAAQSSKELQSRHQSGDGGAPLIGLLLRS